MSSASGNSIASVPQVVDALLHRTVFFLPATAMGHSTKSLRDSGVHSLAAEH